MTVIKSDVYQDTAALVGALCIMSQYLSCGLLNKYFFCILIKCHVL